MNRILPIALVAIVAIAGGTYWYSQPSTTSELAAVTQTSSDDTAASVDATDAADVADGVPDMVLGAPDAPITIVEYASFTCPHCATFHENVFKDLKKDYIDTGKVKFVFREVYFDKFGLWASMIARCGGEERFFGLADLFFKGQNDWARAGDPVAISGSLRKIGRLAGMSDEKLQACMQDGTRAQELVSWYQTNAAADEVTSTPTFIIDGEKKSNMSYADMKAILDAKLAE